MHKATFCLIVYLIFVTYGCNKEKELEAETIIYWGESKKDVAIGPSDISKFQKVAMSGRSFIALKIDGTLSAWGNNENGQIEIPPGLKDIRDIVVDSRFSIAIKNDGTLVGWGVNEGGELDFPEGLVGVVQLEIFYHCVIALKADGTLVSWGNQAIEDFHSARYANLKYFHIYDKMIFLVFKDGTATDEDFYGNQTNFLPKDLEDVKKIVIDRGFAACLFENGAVLIMGDFYSNLALEFETIYDIKDITGVLNSLILLKNDGTLIKRGFNEMGNLDIPNNLRKVTFVIMGYGLVLAIGRLEQ